MTDIFTAFFEVLGISLVGLMLAGWYSIDMLEVFSLRLRRFHDWAQLRIYARRVGLTAYRDAHARVLREQSNAECADDASFPRELNAAADGLRVDSY